MANKKKFKVKKSIAVSMSLTIGIAITIFVTMLLFNVTDYGITIASFGASVFMILSKKDLKRRKIFGAYLIGGSLGFIFSRLSGITSFNVTLAAISSIIAMTIFELQHTPAIGMSIAMVLNKFSFKTDLIVLLCIFFILGMCMLLKMFITDPQKVMNFIEIEEEKIKWNIKKKDVPDYLQIRH